MKNTIKILLLFGIIVFVAFSCEKEEDPTCGCKGDIEFTIEDSADQMGYLYRNTELGNSNVPDYNFGIWYSDINCSNCVHNFFICNDNFLSDLGEIPPYPGIEVKFSGHAKNVCKGIWGPADYIYNNIILTKIELQ